MAVTAEFSYRALDAAGGEVSGAVEATDEDAAFEKLRDRGLAPYRLNRRQQGFPFDCSSGKNSAARH